MKKACRGILAGVLCSALLPAGRAQLPTLEKMGPVVYVQLRLDTTGEATLNAWSRNGGVELAPLLPSVLHCHEGLKAEAIRENAIHCSRGLRRDGLALETELDLAPVARELNGSSGIQLFVNHPRLGFESSSVPMTDEENGLSVARTAQFGAGVVPAPITIRFGYRRGQLAGIYLPMLALALALTLVATFMARAGFAPLALFAILLGTMVWMYAGSQLEAAAPLRILLLGNPLASFVAIFVDLWPPLLCVATGVALGSRLRGRLGRTVDFGTVFGAYAIVPLILTSVVGALPHMFQDEWFAAAGWLAAAPVFALLRRAWSRARARSSIRLLTAGEMKEHISALAVRAGCPQVKAYISFSSKSQAANAFALPGRTIFLTAPLVRMLSKREVDAVAAHELSHMRHSNRGVWTALCIAMLLYETPARDALSMLPGGPAAAVILPIVVFFAALRGSRRREFSADASAAALTGDPRAMISSLAKIARNNDHPMDMSAVTEWFSSHPSTRRRIGALAVMARLDAAGVEALCNRDEPGEHYEIPPLEKSGAESGANVFTLAWQNTNGGIYSWTVILGSCCAGILVAWLLARFTGFGVAPVLGGIVLGCALTKCAAATEMAHRYARLGRKLAAKLGVDGQLVGLAPETVPRIYGGYRFCDAGLLRFENGRLSYHSERIRLAINPVDVVEVGMVAAAPSNWFRCQPMVQFRNPESGQTQGVILHTVNWIATQRRLLRSIERWKATETSTEKTSISGLNPVAGEIFRSPTIAGVARGFLFIESIALAAAIAISWILHCDWRFVACAAAVTGCSYASMMLPAMLYRPSAPPADVAVPAEAD